MSANLEETYYIRTVFALFLGYLSFAMFRLGLGTALPSIIQEMGINEFQAGVLYSISLWTTAALLTFSGWMADRFGRKKILLVGYLFLSLGTLSFSYSPSYSLSVVSLIVSGVASSMIIPSYYSLLGETLRQVRGFAVGLGHASYNIGGLIGSYFIGVFATLNRWRMAFAIIAIIQLLMLLAQIVVIRAPSRRGEMGALTLFDMLKMKNILFSSVGVLLGSISFFAANAWLPSLLISRGCGQAEAGLILGLYFIAGAISSPLFGNLSEKLGRKKTTFYTSAVTATVATVTFLLVKHPLTSMVLIVILGAFIAPYWTLLVTLVQESVPEKNISASVGVAHTLGVLGCAIGPVASGALSSFLKIDYALALSTALPSILCGFTALLFVKEAPSAVER